MATDGIAIYIKCENKIENYMHFSFMAKKWLKQIMLPYNVCMYEVAVNFLCMYPHLKVTDIQLVAPFFFLVESSLLLPLTANLATEKYSWKIEFYE